MSPNPMRNPEIRPDTLGTGTRWGVALALAVLVAASPHIRLARAAGPDAGPSRGWLGPKSVGGFFELRAPGPLAVRLPEAEFLMGSNALEILEVAAECARADPSCSEEVFVAEAPQHPVTIPSFWMDRTEVTVAAYERCVELRRCTPLPYYEGAERFRQPEFPASFVTFEQAGEYCEFRGARLPTEKEFERAARGTEGRRFPWGNVAASRLANHGRAGREVVGLTDASDGFEELGPVGSFPDGGTPEGIQDLAGNVAEWTDDTFAAYQPDPGTPGVGAGIPGTRVAGMPVTSSTTSGPRVLRGGHYMAALPMLRSASRSGAEPELRAPFIGFRCARAARRGSDP